MKAILTILDCGKFLVDVKITPKTFTIKPLELQDDRFVWGCFEQLWDKGIIIKQPKGHKICRHYLEKINDKEFLIYPDRAGIPGVINLL